MDADTTTAIASMDNFIPRPEETSRLREGLAEWPVTVLLGPRQVGKTWLVRPFATSAAIYFDLQTHFHITKS